MASVIIFPETVVPGWTDASDLFWQQTLATLAASGKAIRVGAGLPDSPIWPPRLRAELGRYGISAAVAALRSGSANIRAGRGRMERSDPRDAEAYRNAIVIRGAQQGAFLQQIPAPLGMWHPFSTGGVPLNLLGRGAIQIGNQRAAILICHEQVLAWPVLISMVEHPTVLVIVASDYWIEGTPVPRYQANAVRAWSRLFAVPTVAALNKWEDKMWRYFFSKENGEGSANGRPGRVLPDAGTGLTSTADLFSTHRAKFPDSVA